MRAGCFFLRHIRVLDRHSEPGLHDRYVIISRAASCLTEALRLRVEQKAAHITPSNHERVCSCAADISGSPEPQAKVKRRRGMAIFGLSGGKILPNLGLDYEAAAIDRVH